MSSAKGVKFLPGEDFTAYVARMKVEGYRDDSLTRKQHMELPEHDWMVCKSWHCFDGNPLNRERVLKEIEARRLARSTATAASAPPLPSSSALTKPRTQSSLCNRICQFFVNLW